MVTVGTVVGAEVGEDVNIIGGDVGCVVGVAVDGCIVGAEEEGGIVGNDVGGISKEGGSVVGEREGGSVVGDAVVGEREGDGGENFGIHVPLPLHISVVELQ